MKKTFFIVTAFIVSLSGYGFAEEKIFTVGAEDTSYYPHYAVENSQYIGLAREVLDTFAKKYGYKFDYKPLPVLRLHQSFMKKELDFLYPNNPEWLTEIKGTAKIYYSSPLVNVIDGVMVLPENKGNGLEKLKYLGTIQGFTLPAYTEMIKSKKVKITESYEFKGLIESVINKNNDGAYVTIDCAIHHLRTVSQKPDALVFDPDLPYDIAQHLLSSVKYPEIIENFNIFLREDKQVTEQLMDKYQIMRAVQK
jgi:hypothetical protein